MGTRLSVEEPMLSTGLHLTSESTSPLADHKDHLILSNAAIFRSGSR
jgi:hypothetical protein